ncbi:hypothetical protein CH379_016280 [Leptospira ellisii]|uniref:Uncharacterized protein n=1 Tax=Leptospira ellisii TaxID=2023197 RepID=A0A2N0B8W3_9LEPT|nr:hypothetical protein [Leptospira ellisii]MDV6237191.1 hypothetical protein [Leptospira ellisii]PJZ92997.1 hypothetical protein CH379_10210 [Leptospira ellisii]PKA05649.1 hypothetical protein CH375_04015 [Leptospira ellisii]
MIPLKAVWILVTLVVSSTQVKLIGHKVEVNVSSPKTLEKFEMYFENSKDGERRLENKEYNLRKERPFEVYTEMCVIFVTDETDGYFQERWRHANFPKHLENTKGITDHDELVRLCRRAYRSL